MLQAVFISTLLPFSVAVSTVNNVRAVISSELNGDRQREVRGIKLQLS